MRTRQNQTQIRPLVINQTAHTLAVKDWVRFDVATNKYVKAQANAVANAEVVGRVVAVTANDFDLQVIGLVTIVIAPAVTSDNL